MSLAGKRGRRPEAAAPPELYYGADEARRYTSSSRAAAVQSKLADRALELLALGEGGGPRLILDLGCGSGLSGAAITEKGHEWIGLDIAPAMLDVAVESGLEGGDVALADLGQGVAGMRDAVFDGAISISAVQWLCNADASSHDPRARLRTFFRSLYSALAPGARAALQFYPDGPAQAELITSAAMRAGFAGGLVVDYPHSTRAKKYFLVLMAGAPSLANALPKAKGLDAMDADSEDDDDGDDDDDEGPSTSGEDDDEGNVGGKRVRVTERERPVKRVKRGGKDAGGKAKGSRAWLLRKKEQRRKKGFNVPTDTKYTGRKRKDRF
eukprot:jgi/Chlat1/4941/Chrsp31S04788